MKNKNQVNKITYNYIKVPNKIFKMNLDVGVIALYIYLCSFPEEYNPSLRELGRYLKLSRNTTYKYLSILKRCNIIKEISPSSVELRKSAVYELSNPEGWAIYG